MLVLLIALLVLIAAYLFTRREALDHVARLSAPVLLAALVFQFAAQLLWNGAMLVPLRASLETLGYWELFIVRSGGLLAGYVVPGAGNIAVRLAYLRHRGVTYQDFTWATLLTNVLTLCAAAVLAGCAVAMTWLVTGTTSGPVLVLMTGLLVLGVIGVVTLWGLPRLAGQLRLQRWGWVSGVGRLGASRRTVFAVSALSLGRHLLTFLTFGLLYQSLSPAPASLLTGGLVYAITSPVRMVTITPGNLGVNEWVVAIVGKLLSFDMTTGLLVALVFRGIALAAQVLGALVAGAWLAARHEEWAQDPEDDTS